MNNTLHIKENDVYISDTLIDEEIFIQEKVDWRVEDRENLIDNILDWIKEAKESDRYAMKEDLKYLMNLSDDAIFSSLSTNEYVARSDDEDSFDEICEEILEINKKD
jgi:hypothetical protein